LYEVELIDLEEKIDVKQAFDNIDYDGDDHITLEEVSYGNSVVPPPTRRPQLRSQKLVL
jgi:hypothetical protein